MKKIITTLIIAATILAIIPFSAVADEPALPANIPTNVDGSVTLGYLDIVLTRDGTLETRINADLGTVVFGVEGKWTGIDKRNTPDYISGFMGRFEEADMGGIAKNGTVKKGTVFVWWEEIKGDSVSFEGTFFIEENDVNGTPSSVRFTVNKEPCKKCGKSTCVCENDEVLNIPTNKDGSVTLDALTVRFNDKGQIEILTNKKLSCIVFSIAGKWTGLDTDKKFPVLHKSFTGLFENLEIGGCFINEAVDAGTAFIWWEAVANTVTFEGYCFNEEENGEYTPRRVKFTVVKNGQAVIPHEKMGVLSEQGESAGEPTIFCFVEILLDLIGIESKATNNPAAILSPEGKAAGKPTIFCAIEILQYIVGMSDRTSW
ncbi:MAG: hypothetical protein FWF94_01355 [Oscillospiraceae bacterium]|nr:hypothetical protein [Oscillospiraceae bacterium]